MNDAAFIVSKCDNSGITAFPSFLKYNVSVASLRAG